MEDPGAAEACQEAASSQSAGPVVVIPCPRVVEVHRAAGEPAVGDWATIVLPAGLLRLLMNPVAGGADPLGRGFHPMGTVPYGLAASAAIAACGDPEPLSPRAWRVEYVRARWLRPVSLDADMLGKAQLTEVQPDRVQATLETFDQMSGELLLSGAVRLRRVPEERR